MPRKSHFTTKDDVELLRWWREWLHALDAEMAATDQGDEERRHKRVEMLQRTIANTPIGASTANYAHVSLTMLCHGLTFFKSCVPNGGRR